MIGLDDPIGLAFGALRVALAILVVRTTVATLLAAAAGVSRSARSSTRYARAAVRGAPRALRPALRRCLATAVLTGSVAPGALVATARPAAAVAGRAVVAQVPGTTIDGPRIPDATPPMMWRLDEETTTAPVAAPPDAPPAPAPTPAAPDREPGAGGTTWTIRRGEHLWLVADQVLTAAHGRSATTPQVAAYHRELIERNRSRLTDPTNPDLVFAGQVLSLPPIPA